jgi:ubiquinone/menaquinone biosynthesis C-methylase UbiE
MIELTEIPAVSRVPNRYSKECINAAERYLKACKNNTDSSFWAVRMFTSLNLFLSHLEIFSKDLEPSPIIAKKFNDSSELLENITKSKLFNSNLNSSSKYSSEKFESRVAGLFSDIWLDMTDEIYFDETYNYTYERLEKNKIDPKTLFKEKEILDAGCGSGKFSATIAKLGASKVIGLDIGEQAIKFARKQAKKISYGGVLEFREGSLLDIPLDDNSVDMVWSNGVIHHTINYDKCVEEFSRVIKSDGTLFLYVNGFFGLYELIQDTLRISNSDIPRDLFQNYIKSLGVNSGRLYWLMDSLYAPYEYRSREDVISLLSRNNFTDIKQLKRGVSIDQIEQVTMKLPYAEEKYGDSQLKFICRRL